MKKIEILAVVLAVVVLVWLLWPAPEVVKQKPMPKYVPLVSYPALEESLKQYADVGWVIDSAIVTFTNSASDIEDTCQVSFYRIVHGSDTIPEPSGMMYKGWGGYLELRPVTRDWLTWGLETTTRKG